MVVDKLVDVVVVGIDDVVDDVIVYLMEKYDELKVEKVHVVEELVEYFGYWNYDGIVDNLCSNGFFIVNWIIVVFQNVLLLFVNLDNLGDVDQVWVFFFE